MHRIQTIKKPRKLRNKTKQSDIRNKVIHENLPSVSIPLYLATNLSNLPLVSIYLCFYVISVIRDVNSVKQQLTLLQEVQ